MQQVKIITGSGCHNYNGNQSFVGWFEQKTFQMLCLKSFPLV